MKLKTVLNFSMLMAAAIGMALLSSGCAQPIQVEVVQPDNVVGQEEGEHRSHQGDGDLGSRDDNEGSHEEDRDAG